MKEVMRNHLQQTLQAEKYANLSTAEGAELLATMDWAVDAFMRCLREQRPLAKEELARFEALGTQSARQGISFNSLQESFRRGIEQCSSELTGMAFGTSGPQAGRMPTSMTTEEPIPSTTAAEDAFTARCGEGRGLPQEALTKQELSVLRLLPGLSNHQISTLLGRSPETVKSQVAEILRKLGARDRAHAVAIGISHGLIPDRF